MCVFRDAMSAMLTTTTKSSTCHRILCSSPLWAATPNRKVRSAAKQSLGYTVRGFRKCCEKMCFQGCENFAFFATMFMNGFVKPSDFYEFSHNIIPVVTRAKISQLGQWSPKTSQFLPHCRSLHGLYRQIVSLYHTMQFLILCHVI